MARDLIRFSNDKKGFISLLAVVALLLIWAAAATFSALQAGETRQAVYGAICLLGIGYIFVRSLRSFFAMRRKEQEQKGRNGEKK